MRIFKNIHKASIGLLLLSLLQIGCKKDFLDEYNPANRTTDNFYVDGAGLDALVNSCYPLLRDITQSRQLTLRGTDLFTANGWGGIFYALPNQDGNALEQFDIRLNSTWGDLSGYWDNLYKEINRCNTVLTRQNNFKGVTQAVMNSRIGEAKFLRALSYFWLVQQWGDVPMPLTESLAGTLSADKTLAKDIYTQIVTDLTACVANMPVTQTDNGRITQGAAKFLLAKVLLTRGWNFNNSLGGTPADFTAALKLCDEIIASNLYPLEAKWADLFPIHPKNVTAAQPAMAASVAVANVSKEVIFAVQYANPAYYNGDGNLDPAKGLIGNNMHSQFYPGPAGIAQAGGASLWYTKLQGGGFNPTWAAYRMYDPQLDTRYDGTFNSVCYATTANTTTLSALNNNLLTVYPAPLVYAIGDTTAIVMPWNTPVTLASQRGKNQVGGTKNYSVNNISEIVGYNPTAGVKDNMFWAAPMFWKFFQPNVSYNDGFSTYNDPIFRSAEVYLLAAEAIVKGGTGAVLGTADVYYNKVLDRALGTANAGKTPNRALNPEKGTEAPTNVLAYRATPANISIDMILDESGREFLGESMRWYDLKRTQTIGTRAAKYNPWVGYGLNGVQQFNAAKHYLRPIPQSMIDVTLPKITQNPLY
jgi:hypothetical protein